MDPRGHSARLPCYEAPLQHSRGTPSASPATCRFLGLVTFYMLTLHALVTYAYWGFVGRCEG